MLESFGLSPRIFSVKRHREARKANIELKEKLLTTVSTEGGNAFHKISRNLQSAMTHKQYEPLFDHAAEGIRL